MSVALSANQNFGTSFESQLRLEVSRILADVIFVRSPVQAKLLEFLLERSVSGDSMPTQYEIAVDALGRSSDYDLDSDSYPRVQISRLRKNLENYYERNLPGNERQVVIERGQYRLTLARAEAEPSPEQADPYGDLQLDKGSDLPRYHTEAFALIAILIAVFVGGAYSWSELFSTKSEMIEQPAVKFELDDGASIDGLSDHQQLVENTRRIVQKQLINSFTSKLANSDAKDADFDYRFGISFRSSPSGATSAFISLKDRENDFIYSGDLEYDAADPSLFYSELEGVLLYLTAPTGVIAVKELQGADEAQNSDFLCFLRIESQRSEPGLRRSLIDDCIADFPESPYAAFWLTRRSYESYQNHIAQGGNPERSGEAWNDLQSALEVDPSNAFATFVAAKIELAHRDCRAAETYLRRSYSRANSYPVLIAFLETDASDCSLEMEGGDVPLTRIAKVFEVNPDPDPFLQLYLMLAEIASSDLESARTIASRRGLSRPSGVVQETSHLVREALNGKKLRADEMRKLDSNIRLFVWSDKARRKITANLERGIGSGR